MSLSTIGGIIAEASAIYRKMKAGKLDHEEGRSLVWCLTQLRGMVETKLLEEMQTRLNELTQQAERRNGVEVAAQPLRLPN